MIFVFCWCTAHAQDSLSKWKLIKEYPIQKNAIWNVDILQNVYVVQDRLIVKYDSTGIKKFSQSIKSLGQVKEILPINTMKLVLFSEDQQVLCMLDNTLTMSEDLIDLSNFDIVNASLATTSSQPEKIWILDQLNSRLILLDLSGKMQFQEVRNLKGVLNLSEITGMTESGGHLYLVSSNHLYEFDIYGTLLNELEYVQDSDSRMNCFPSGERFYWISKDELIGKDLDGGNEKGVKLPVNEVIEFKKSGEIYYFRSGDKILKYAFKNVH